MSLLPGLHLKYADRGWSETFQLVRRCMDKSRDESKPCQPLVRTLERLQEVFNVSSLNAMKSRLEVIAEQRGMGFHLTDTTCYLTADLFYVEVVLLPCGRVEELKVAPHGASPVSSVSLCQLLRSKHFAEFTKQLEGLYTQYNVPGDNEIKFKLYSCLQHLGKDLQEMSCWPRQIMNTDSKMETINDGWFGCVIADKQDCPLTLQFYMNPNDGPHPSVSFVQVAQVAVGPSNVSHKLQVASAIQLPPQPDPKGYVAFIPLNELPCEMFSAHFLLKLQPPIPVMLSFIEKINQITDVAIPVVDLQWAPIPKLLKKSSVDAKGLQKASDELDNLFTVLLPGDVMHSYIFPGAAWEVPAKRGTLLSSIPFTHPVHVPALVELLRHQCAFNALLRSCMNESSGSACDQHFEVHLESDTSFSVTFQQPYIESLCVLNVNVSDHRKITCILFGKGLDCSLDDYIASILKRCMSIPLTLHALYSKLQPITSAPLSSSCSSPAETENDRFTPSCTAVTPAAP